MSPRPHAKRFLYIFWLSPSDSMKRTLLCHSLLPLTQEGTEPRGVRCWSLCRRPLRRTRHSAVERHSHPPFVAPGLPGVIGVICRRALGNKKDLLPVLLLVSNGGLDFIRPNHTGLSGFEF